MKLLIVQARWQSGYAAACKAVDAGSIPTPASIFTPNKAVSAGAWNWVDFIEALDKCDSIEMPRD